MIDLVIIGLLGVAGAAAFVIIKEVFRWGYNKETEREKYSKARAQSFKNRNSK